MNFKKKGLPIAVIKYKKKDEKDGILYLDIKSIVNPPVLKGNKKKSNSLLKPICKYCNKEFYSNWDMKIHQEKSCRMKQFKDFIESEKSQDERNNVDEIIIDKGILWPLPRKDRREILYIAGPQGSGKSYYTAQYIKEYKKVFPKNDVILFSRIEKDKSFKDIKPMRIKLDNKLLSDPIDAKKELIRSCVIFDDIETMDKNVKKYMEALRNDVIKNGRDQEDKGNDIYCVCTNHQVSDYNKTRDLLNECTSITVFPKAGSSYGAERVLKIYFGLGKKQIDKLMNLPSRWVSIYSSFPQYVLYEKGAYLLYK